MFKSKNPLLQLACGIAAMLVHTAYAQQPIPLNDLSAFTAKSDNWKIVGNATADIAKENALTTTPGKGVLACIHEKGKYGNQYELISNFKHGDLDIELDFMLAKGSNSGIYLQGNYEVQLFDSWGKKSAKYNDCGGIYERWNDAKPEGEKGYEGYAPRYNVAKAPGLWQHIKISYQAPRFDANGKKTSNAVFLSVVLNGMTIHENVEVSGPTRGALTEDVPMGPIRFQGDHGSLAIKNIVINNFDKKAGTLSDLNYKIYYGGLSETEDLSKQTPAETGKAEALSWEILKENNNYSYVYTGRYNAATDGKYDFRLQASGNSYVKIDGKYIIQPEWKNNNEFRESTVDLKAGDHSIEIFNNKKDGWMRPVLGLWVSGPGFREVAYHTKSSAMAGGATDPILIGAANNTITRSFMDFRKDPKDKRTRIVHAVSVGSPTNLHYTYDLDKGTVLQVWRGEFLDATPMWHDRGDGSSRPRGSVTLLGDDMFLGKASSKAKWPTDTTGSGYRPKGYVVDDADVPTFQYQAFGSNITDYISVVNNQYFERIVKVNNPGKDLVARLADGSKIEKVADGLYAIDDKSYYIQLADKTVKPEIRSANGSQELLVPVSNGEVKYSILF